jgi:hypothetical protein
MYVLKTSLLVPKIGPCKEIRDCLKTSVESQLRKVEDKVLEKCETVFKDILHDLEIICPRRVDDTPGATKRRYALGEVVEEAKATFNTEVRAKLLECRLRLE